MTTLSAVALAADNVVPVHQAPAVAVAAGTQNTQAQKKTSGPVAAIRHLLEVGKASWYGLQFQGRKTSSGERFDMNELTCAHRTLPLGSWLRVTNLRNKKSVVVRVNDRGPMVDDRVIDLSYAAAQAVGMDGLGKVKLEPLSRNDPAVAKMELNRVIEAQLRLPTLPVGVR
jgi:rare lipoprotein A